MEEADFEEIRGAFMCIRISHNGLKEMQEEESIKEVNLLHQIIHEVVIENGGYLFEQDENVINCCWKLDSGSQNQDFVLTQSLKFQTE